MKSKNIFAIIFIVTFPSICIFIYLFLLSSILESFSSNLHGFKHPRNEEYINYSLIKNNGIIEVFDKYKKITEFNYNVLASNDVYSVRSLIKDKFNFIPGFNIKVKDQIIVIYTSNLIGDEVYKLEPGEIRCFDDLLNAKILKYNNPVGSALEKVFIYLLCMGYFDSKFLILYKYSVLIYSTDGRCVLFNVDLNNILPSRTGKNTFVAALATTSKTLFFSYYKQMWRYENISLGMFVNSFEDFLNYRKNRKIESLVEADRYYEIKNLIPQTELDYVFDIARKNLLLKL